MWGKDKSVANGARAELVAASLRRLASLLGALVCMLVLAGVPGASLRPLVVEITAPPVPSEVSERDASLEVDVTRKASEGEAPPLPGARVRAFSLIDGRAFAAADVVADGAGHASLERLPRGEHWIVAEASGYARASRMVLLVPGARSLALSLGAEHVLEVEVVDEKGRAIPDAEVEVMGGDPFPVGSRSDSEGRARVTRLSEGPYNVSARSPGYDEASLRRVAGGAPARVVLKKLGALRITVLGVDEKPRQKARVEITSAVLWPSRYAETDAKGQVRIAGLAAGAYSLRAVSATETSATEVAVSLAEGEEKTMTLHLAAGVEVVIRVLDGDGEPKEPLRGAKVTLAEGGLSAFPQEGTTDRDGRVTLGPIGRGGSAVTVRAEGYVSMTVAVPDDPGKYSKGYSPSGPLEITLPRAGVVVGRVVDARGFPVGGARIEIVGTDFQGGPIDDDPRRTRFRDRHFASALGGPGPLLPAGELGVMPGPVPDIPRLGAVSSAAGLRGSSPPETMSVQVDPWVSRRDGTFRAAPATPGRIRVLVRHPQHVEAMSEVVTLMPATEAHVDVVMHEGGLLEGRLVDGHDRPVEGAWITALATHGTLERQTRSDRDGSFAFASLPPSVTLLVERSAGSGGSVRLDVDVPEGGKKSVRLVLPDPREAIPVRVVDARGLGVSAAQVTAHALEPEATLRATVFTDRRGEASLADAKGLALRLEIHAPGHATRVLDVPAAATEVRAELRASESLTGEVRSSRRDPLAQAEITIYGPDGARHVRTGADGTFVVDDLAPGPVRVRVRASGFAPETFEVIVAETGGRRPTALKRVELDEEGAVEGVVVDARGDAVPGARVAKDSVPVYLVAGATPPGLALADARGRFRLAELGAGTVTLEAYAPDVGRARLEGVRVTSGRTTKDIRIVVQRSKERASEPNARGGVAITLGETAEGREVVVISVVEGSAAERAGLSPGDTLLEVSGAPVRTIEEARGRLSGPLGNDVIVKLRREHRIEIRRVPREEVRR